MQKQKNTSPSKIRRSKKKKFFKNTKKTFEKEIYVLGGKISELEIYVIGFDTLLHQINSNRAVYHQFDEFFYNVYESFYYQIIHRSFQLIDENKKVLSFSKILDKNISDSDAFKKIKEIRHNIAAHMNKELALDKEKFNSYVIIIFK